MPKEHPKIIQLQWHKEGEEGEQKLVVFNPTYSTLYYVNVTLELVKETNTMELQGSILHLQEVTEKDSGGYVCDIASFPDGSIKTFTKVQVIGKFIMNLNRGGTVCKYHNRTRKYIFTVSTYTDQP